VSPIDEEAAMPQVPQARKVPTRRMSFEESLADVPRHFAVDGDLLLSHVTAALSSVFPDGEDYFVRSVRRFRDQITDPELKREVTGFIGQEAMHGREHRAFNDRLAELGYPSKGIEAFVRRSLTFREKVMSPNSNLALTAALEHYTATLAELVLTSELTRHQFGDPAVRDLFVWHALEESEHKAVAFDVYRGVGGTERMRVVTMKVISVIFPTAISVMMLLSLLRDPATYRPGRLRRSWATFRSAPLLSREVRDQLRTYNRPGFHPDDRDTTGLVAEWREILFGEQGSLNDKLLGSAA
jgi:predicted metal-dependent hydrolase